MRGKVQPDADGCRPPRITPAYVGKRRAAKRYKRLLWDHPRVCGEKDAICKSCPARQGSPSRMRGKAGWPLCGLPCIGITPAYAGKSQPWRSYSQRRWDHPRVCGEKPSGVMAALACAGITPAYAGKSTNSELSSPCTRDHPRVCGEKHTKGQTRPRVAGSPPRMRGKATKADIESLGARITPAYAGKRIEPTFADHR